MLPDAFRAGIRNACWETLAAWAQVAQDERGDPRRFRYGHWSRGDDESWRWHAMQRAKGAGLSLDIGKVEDPSRHPEGALIENELRAVYYEALHAGFIVPGTRRTFAPNDVGSFMFTQRGIQVLARDNPLIADDGSVRRALEHARTSEGLAVTNAQVELLAEAQRCWIGRCYRAAIVMIGLANEDTCLALVDALPLNLQLPSDPNLKHDWINAADTNNHFAARWRPALRVLAAVHKGLRPQMRGTEWRRWWEGVPGCLDTLGEAVRWGRNAAAHDPDREFGRVEVALLLASMPHQLRLITELTAFLAAPAQGVQLPTL